MWLCRRTIVGLIVAPLCWKASEWIGLSIGCGVAEVLQSLSDSLAQAGYDRLPGLRLGRFLFCQEYF